MIIVGGMIGVGKTTYVQILEQEYASRAFYESVDDNPILEKFYAEPDKYAFMSQIYFALTRFASMREASKYPRLLIDRSIYEDMLFAEVNHDLNRMTYEEKLMYDMLMAELLKEVKAHYTKSPHLLVYLKASFETILARISLRNRAFEQDKALVEYYRALHMRYDEWMFAHHYAEHTLVIDADKYDIQRPEDKKIIVNEISLKLLALGL